MAGIILAFGFFFSCTVLESVREPFRSGDEKAQTLETELREVERQLEEEDNPRLHLRKGELLSLLAGQTEQPSRRTPRYREMRRTLQSLSGVPSRRRQAEEILTEAWTREQNRGVEIIGRDTTSGNRSLARAAEHFENAIVIRPDSAISYRMKAQAHYRNGNPEEAVTTLEQARQEIPDLPWRMTEQLAFLYLESGQIDRAVKLYETAEATAAGDRNVIHGLANAYMENADHRKSVALLNHLIDRYPENPAYGQARATELYFAGWKVLEEGNADAMEQADSLFRSAGIQYNQLINLEPDNLEYRQQAVDFYQNVAALYRARSTDDDEAETRVTERIEHYLSASVPHFEFLIEESEPGEKRSSWVGRLLTIYTWLGMDDRAMELRSNY